MESTLAVATEVGQPGKDALPEKIGDSDTKAGQFGVGPQLVFDVEGSGTVAGPELR